MDGFVSADSLVYGGVYALTLRGRVVYVDYARNIAKRVDGHLAMMRGSMSWLKRRGAMEFDGVQIRRCHPDDAQEVIDWVIAIHNPIYNQPAEPTPAMILIERRI